jgi:hypothetical protein
MMSEKKIREKYNETVEFLLEQDEQTAPSDLDVYDAAVREYGLLHDILQIKTPKKWTL